MDVCVVPGCGTPLYNRNRTGVCRAHVHLEGYCKCVQCDPEDFAKKKRLVLPEPRGNLLPLPEPEPEPEPDLLVPDPETASFAEMCAPLSAKVRSRHTYNWATMRFSTRGEEE